MKSLFFIPVAVATILFTAAALALRAQDVPAKQVFPFTPDDLKKYSRIDYIIGTEMTDAGRKLPTPEFDKPQYYIMQSVERHDIGDARGDTKGTKDIPVATLKKYLTSALASNGYLPADADHPPTQVLTFVCGVLNKIDLVKDAGGDSAGGDGSSAEASRLQNLRSRAEIVGGKKFAGEFVAAFAGQLQCSGTTGCEPSDSLRRFVARDDPTGALVYEIVNDNDCYYCIVTSHDMDALKDNGGKLLWTTRASKPHIPTTARSVSFDLVLRIMVNNASWYFGRETDGVEVVGKSIVCGPVHVDIPEAEVVGYYYPGATPGSGTFVPVPKPVTSGTAPASGKP